MAAEIYAKIERQCGWWEMYARVAPVASLMMFLIIWYFSRELVETVIVTGVALLCGTLVTWWYWAVRSVAQLARSNWIMHEKLGDIHQEIRYAKAELQELKKDVPSLL